jgi:hypothetical protein
MRSDCSGESRVDRQLSPREGKIGMPATIIAVHDVDTPNPRFAFRVDGRDFEICTDGLISLSEARWLIEKPEPSAAIYQMCRAIVKSSDYHALLSVVFVGATHAELATATLGGKHRSIRCKRALCFKLLQSIRSLLMT